MIGLFCFALAVPASPFKSKLRLEAENAVLRHQLIVLRRRRRGRLRLTNLDRWYFIQLYRWFPAILKALTIIVRWHRAGFRWVCALRYECSSIVNVGKFYNVSHATISRLAAKAMAAL